MTDETPTQAAAQAAGQAPEGAGDSPVTTTATQPPTVEEPLVADATPQSEPEVTLQEYLIRLSQRDSRIELINAFHFTETQDGHLKDTESRFDARLKAFSETPIEG